MLYYWAAERNTVTHTNNKHESQKYHYVEQKKTNPLSTIVSEDLEDQHLSTQSKLCHSRWNGTLVEWAHDGDGHMKTFPGWQECPFLVALVCFILFLLILIYFILFYWDSISLCSPGWLRLTVLLPEPPLSWNSGCEAPCPTEASSASREMTIISSL